MTPEIQRAFQVAQRFIRQTDLNGYCLEASVVMAEHLRRHRTREADRRIKLVRRKIVNDGHWTVEVDGQEYDPTCAYWDWTGARVPVGLVPRELYEVSPRSPHRFWRRTRIHLRYAYEAVGITRKLRRRK